MTQTQREILDDLLSERSVADALFQWKDGWRTYEKLKHYIDTLDLEAADYEAACVKLAEELDL